MTIDSTACPTPGKRNYSTRAEAKKVIRRVRDQVGRQGLQAYLCACGFFHTGHSDFLDSRQAHRERHGAEPRPEDEPVSMSLRMAATELGAKDETLLRAIEAGKLDAWENRPGHWRVPVREVERLKTLTMRSY